jgi:hypothetical protein
MTKPVPQKPPKALDAIADVVLAYRPKPKTKPARKRQRIRKQMATKGKVGQNGAGQ